MMISECNTEARRLKGTTLVWAAVRSRRVPQPSGTASSACGMTGRQEETGQKLGRNWAVPKRSAARAVRYPVGVANNTGLASFWWRRIAGPELLRNYPRCQLIGCLMGCMMLMMKVHLLSRLLSFFLVYRTGYHPFNGRGFQTQLAAFGHDEFHDKKCLDHPG